MILRGRTYSWRFEIVVFLGLFLVVAAWIMSVSAYVRLEISRTCDISLWAGELTFELRQLRNDLHWQGSYISWGAQLPRWRLPQEESYFYLRHPFLVSSSRYYAPLWIPFLVFTFLALYRLGTRALVFVQRRRANLCVNCGYCRIGLLGMTCPECGRTCA